MVSRVKIAIVVNSFPKISETFILNKVLSLIHSGFDVTVISGSRKGDEKEFLERSIDLEGVKVMYTLPIAVPLRLAFSLFSYFLRHPVITCKLFWQSRKIYSKNRQALKAFILAIPLKVGLFDIIHFEMSGIAVAYLDAFPLLKPAKLVTSCRGAAEQITPLVDSTRPGKLNTVFQEIDLVHCVSHDILQTAEKYGLDRAKAFVNHPAIDPDQFIRTNSYPGNHSGPFRLVSVGRLHWKKGLEFGLLAVKQLKEKGLDVQYDIAGSGFVEEQLRYMVDALEITRQVNFLGSRSSSQVKELLELADVFILPSTSEGISNAVLEAMAMELPVVSTAVGGMNEVIRDGVEGFLVPPYQPDVMAEKIAALLRDYELRLKMGQAGRKTIKQIFPLQQQTHNFIEQYSGLIIHE